MKFLFVCLTVLSSSAFAAEARSFRPFTLRDDRIELTERLTESERQHTLVGCDGALRALGPWVDAREEKVDAAGTLQTVTRQSYRTPCSTPSFVLTAFDLRAGELNAHTFHSGLIADFNRDGVPDFIVVKSELCEQWVLLLSSAGTWTVAARDDLSCPD